MQVFKCYFKVVKKNLVTIIIYMVAFFLILGVGLTIANPDQETDGFEKMKMKVSVIDRDNSELSKALGEYIQKNQTRVNLKDEKESIADSLFARNVDYILIIPKNFQEDMQRDKGRTENIKVPGSYSGYFLDQQVNQYLKTAGIYLQSGFSLSESVNYTKEDMNLGGKVSLVNKENVQTSAKVYSFFRYLPYIFLLILLNGLTPVLMTFQRSDIRKRNECSSLTIWDKNKQIMSASVVLSLGIWVVLITAGLVIFGLGDVAVHNVYAVINTLGALIVSAAVSYLLGVLITTKGVLTMAANVTALGFTFLGGVFVPQNLMSEKVLSVSRFIPTYWYVKVNTILSDTLQLGEMNKQTVYLGILVQFGFAAAIISVALVMLKLKRDAG